MAALLAKASMFINLKKTQNKILTDQLLFFVDQGPWENVKRLNSICKSVYGIKQSCEAFVFKFGNILGTKATRPATCCLLLRKYLCLIQKK